MKPMRRIGAETLRNGPNGEEESEVRYKNIVAVLIAYGVGVFRGTTLSHPEWWTLFITLPLLFLCGWIVDK
jgi:hypothetical protein